jgi:hypothetical protein
MQDSPRKLRKIEKKLADLEGSGSKSSKISVLKALAADLKRELVQGSSVSGSFLSNFIITFIWTIFY